MRSFLDEVRQILTENLQDAEVFDMVQILKKDLVAKDNAYVNCLLSCHTSSV